MHQNDMLEVIEAAKKGDRTAKSHIIETNERLLWSIVLKFQNRGHEKEDLFQIACIGMIKAIEKFDTSFGVKFSTYAVSMIIGEIKRFIRDDGLIKVSRSLKEISNKVRITREILLKKTGSEPSINELATELNIPPEDIIIAQEACYQHESLYSTTNDKDSESGILLIDRITTKNSDNEIIDKIALNQVLATLSKREKQIIILRYFKDKTQVQVSKMLGISQVQVSRIEKQILNNMRESLKS